MAGQPKSSFVFERQFRWDLGNDYLQSTMTETKDGKTELRHRSMIGWEPKTQQITEWGFWSSNPSVQLPPLAETVTWVKEDGKWRIEMEDGNGLFTIIDKDTHKYECTFNGDDGSDNSWHFTARRKPKTVSPNYEHLKVLEDFIADWVADETLSDDIPGVAKKGEKMTTRVSARWIANRGMMQLEITNIVSGGTTVESRWLLGWDSKNNEICYTGVDSIGGRDWGTLKKEGQDNWIWQMKWITPDGKEASCTDTMTVLENNSTHVHEYTHNVMDGKPQPDRKMVYKRASK